jgi:exoribonuclease R
MTSSTSTDKTSTDKTSTDKTSAYILQVTDRDYTHWSWLNNVHTQEAGVDISPQINPLERKLLHGDIINAADGKLIHSPYGQQEEIPGVLLVDGNTYGRQSGNKASKLLYKCIPNDTQLPCFLIPYEEKIEFAKTKINKYVTFRLKEWTDKHPLGTLTNTYGDTSCTEAYANYQLHCKELDDSIKQLNAYSLRALRENTLGPIPLYYNNQQMEDRRDCVIFSIDPKGCVDIDDAMGIQETVEDTIILSIYISNVPIILEYLNMWSYLTDRISTIYFPHKKIPMLPVALSDNICSLREKENRIAFAMDFYIQNNRLLEIKYNRVIIKVEKNFVYDEPALISHPVYKAIFNTVRLLNLNKRRHTQYLDNITNSHEVVEYCMLLMNHECAKILRAKKCGIFRSATMNNNAKHTDKEDTDKDHTDKEEQAQKEEAAEESTNYQNLAPEFKQVLRNVVGEYCTADNIKPHELIDVDCYVHITSPIRRLVDCVNLIEIQSENFAWSAEALKFIKKWQALIGLINTKTRATRKIQNEVELLTLYNKNQMQVYLGVVFEKKPVGGIGISLEEQPIQQNKIKYKYRVYIAELKLLTSVISEKNLENYSPVNLTTHLFLEEAKMAKKIRLQLL